MDPSSSRRANPAWQTGTEETRGSLAFKLKAEASKKDKPIRGGNRNLITRYFSIGWR